MNLIINYIDKYVCALDLWSGTWLIQPYPKTIIQINFHWIEFENIREYETEFRLSTRKTLADASKMNISLWNINLN